MLGARNYSITKKLIRMNLLVSGTALLIACAVLGAYDLISFRQTMVHNLSIQAQIAGSNSVSALLFNDPQAAENTLSALKAAPNVAFAGIYTLDDRPFATYWRDGNSQTVTPPQLAPNQIESHWFKAGQLVLVRTIVFQGKPAGTVYIRSDMRELSARLRRGAEIAVVVLLASLIAAFLSASVTQRAVAEPIVHLAEIAGTVSRDKNYAIRATPTGKHDEPDILIEAFNEMLAQIQRREGALQQAHNELEQRVEDRTAQLQLQTSLLQSVLNNMKDGVVVADAQEKFLVFNPAAEAILTRGATNQPSSGWAQYYRVFLPDAVTPFPAEQLPLVRAIHGESCQDVEMFLDRPEKPGGGWISVSANPLKGANGDVEGGIAVFRDITEMRRIREELAHRVEELSALNQELEAFTYSVSHDLRAPLRHIDGFSKILEEEHSAELTEPAREYLTLIRSSTKEMGQLVDDLLTLARIGRKNLILQLAGLSSIVEEVVTDLKRENTARSIEWKIGKLPFLECDPGLMKQVFANLLSNAVKFTRLRERAVIEVGATQQDGGAAIFVRDNGVGFNMKSASKLFGVFQRLHRQEDFEGTGVGLATVQRIIHKHGGRIWAEAKLDEGATFYFTLGVPEKDTIRGEERRSEVRNE